MQNALYHKNTSPTHSSIHDSHLIPILRRCLDSLQNKWSRRVYQDANQSQSFHDTFVHILDRRFIQYINLPTQTTNRQCPTSINFRSSNAAEKPSSASRFPEANPKSPSPPAMITTFSDNPRIPLYLSHRYFKSNYSHFDSPSRFTNVSFYSQPN